MFSLHALLMILAIVSFFLAALDVKLPRLNVMAVGLFLWALATVVSI